MTAPTPHRPPRWLMAVAMSLVLIVVFSSFALSFTVLRDLAALAGIPESVAWLWPVIVDGTITAATVVLYTSRGTGRRPVRPLVTLIVFAAASVVGNVAHILIVDPSQVVPAAIAVFVGITPPVGLIMTVEILGGLLRQPDSEVGQEPETPGAAPAQHHEPVLTGSPDLIQRHEPVVAHEPSRAVEPVVHMNMVSAVPVAQPEVSEPEPVTMVEPVAEPVDEDTAASSVEQVETPKSEPVEQAAQAQVVEDDHDVEQHEPEPVPAAEPEVDRDLEPVTKSVSTSKVDKATTVAQARELIDGGESIRATAEQLDVSRATLSRWLKAAENESKEEMAPVTQLRAVND